MPQILVTAESSDDGGATVLLRERITLPDLESGHFAAQLVERMGWALADADDLEHASERKDRTIPRKEVSPRRSLID